ncbi:rhs element Vgr protein [Pseudomonas arsenicoxydans]|uniref:Rhs element Vgr protein n=1 Tax=Pseudomonas arsenicoxydans TaxID=702115 RepID=A0A4P6G221_9PSED|nr:rhs element Vgr protein [Pseudomonas arsenicoxydans]QAY85405.1 rhs element Vgr protein [Pseudomonas arsenicoxydans]
MDLNEADVTPGARQVIGRVLLNGTEVPFSSFYVDSNSFYSADTFSATFPLTGMPEPMNTVLWWSQQTAIEVTISVGLIDQASVNWKTLIIGGVDKPVVSMSRFEVTVDGRDYTSKLIDTKTSEKFSNYTTSQVANMLAARHGLTPVVTPTTTSVGAITKFDHTHINDERSEWDLISYFAGMDGFQTYVVGNELHYEPALDPATTDQYLIRWVPPGELAYPMCNTTEGLDVERDLTLAKGVTVSVRSWKGGKAYTETYPNSSAKGIAPGNATPKRQVYSVVRSGLDRQAAQQLAQKLHKQITDHEMRIGCSLPGDNILMPNTIIRVEGTNSDFDQLYYADSVRRSLSFESGYTMSVTAKNHNPNSMVLP